MLCLIAIAIALSGCKPVVDREVFDIGLGLESMNFGNIVNEDLAFNETNSSNGNSNVSIDISGNPEEVPENASNSSWSFFGSLPYGQGGSKGGSGSSGPESNPEDDENEEDEEEDSFFTFNLIMPFDENNSSNETETNITIELEIEGLEFGPGNETNDTNASNGGQNESDDGDDEEENEIVFFPQNNEKPAEVPEFGTLAALAVLGSAGYFINKNRKRYKV